MATKFELSASIQFCQMNSKSNEIMRGSTRWWPWCGAWYFPSKSLHFCLYWRTFDCNLPTRAAWFCCACLYVSKRRRYTLASSCRRSRSSWFCRINWLVSHGDCGDGGVVGGDGGDGGGIILLVPSKRLLPNGRSNGLRFSCNSISAILRVPFRNPNCWIELFFFQINYPAWI